MAESSPLSVPLSRPLSGGLDSTAATLSNALTLGGMALTLSGQILTLDDL